MILPRPVRRETAATVRDRGKDRELIVILHPRAGTMDLRLKGTRQIVSVRLTEVWYHAQMMAAGLSQGSRTIKRGVL